MRHLFRMLLLPSEDYLYPPGDHSARPLHSMGYLHSYEGYFVEPLDLEGYFSCILSKVILEDPSTRKVICTALEVIVQDPLTW